MQYLSKSGIYISKMSVAETGELSYCELRSKEVVNSVDGRRLGRIVDIVFSSNGGEICGIVVPYSRKAMFFKSRDVFIPWECIKKIGEDVIIVELFDFCGKPTRKNERLRCSPPPKPPEEPCKPPSPSGKDCNHGDGGKTNGAEPNCDRRCEKCMLFDCQHRWNEQVHNGEGVYVDNNYN